MTQSNDRPAELDDDMLPEYDLSQFGSGVRGKYAAAMRQGYSVTVHHADGTATTRQVPPDPSTSNPSMNDGKNYHWQGDRINGDKVMGDKITHHHSQNLAQAAQDIKELLDQLDQDYDRSTPTGQAMIGAQAISEIEKNPTLKARVVNALKEGGTTALEVAIDHPVAKPVVAMLKGFMNAK